MQQATRASRARVGAGAFVVLAGMLAACSPDYPAITQPLTRVQSTAALTGAALTPAVQTSATGSVTAAEYDTNTVRIEVLVSGITGVTSAQLRAGQAGEAGRPMFTIFSASTPTATLNGVLRLVDASRGGSGFVAPFTIDSVRARLRAGTAFVVVNTSANPTGELRGQLSAAQ